MIALEKFLLPEDAPRDLTAALVRASMNLRDGDTLVFPGGEWELSPEMARCELLGITNHDYHHRLTALHLKGLRGVVIEGSGCVLRAAGPVCPLWFEDCADLSIRDLTLDRKHSFNIWGRIASMEKESLTVEIDREFNPPWGAWAGELFVNLPCWRGRVEVLFEWDMNGNGPAKGSADNLGDWNQQWAYEKLGPTTLRIKGRRRHDPALGNILMLRTHGRPAPALPLSNCERVDIERVHLSSAGGMGVIAQRCRDILVSECTTRRNSGGGAYSDVFDATHFANCAGLITLENCKFLGQLDDGTNIHGAYFPVARHLDEHTLLIERRHFQQAGAPVGGLGDQFVLCDQESLEESWTGVCESCEETNPHFAVLKFQTPLPKSVRTGDVLDNVTWQPQAVIRNNEFRHNRARGILLSSRGAIRVEENVFQTPGAAIAIGGGVSSWFESSRVTSVKILQNQFVHCATEPAWGKAVIQCGPGPRTLEKRSEPFHRGLVIANNTFDLAAGTLALGVQSCGAIEWSENSGVGNAIALSGSTLVEAESAVA